MRSWAKIRPILEKALAVNSKPTAETFPELPQVLLWFRFVLAVLYGLSLGRYVSQNAVWLLQSLNLIFFVPFLYCRFYLRTNDESYDFSVMFSGTVNAWALCTLIWIYFYTAANEESEAKLSSLLLSAVQRTLDTSSSSETPLPSESATEDLGFAPLETSPEEMPEL